MLLSERGTILKFNTEVRIAGQTFRQGEIYSVWIQSGKKAAALIVKHGKRGHRLTTSDSTNVKGIHEVEVAALISNGKLEIKKPTA